MIKPLLQENLKSEIAKLSSENSALRERIDSLERFLITMKREKFGKKSERIIDDGSAQISLWGLLSGEDKSIFNEAEAVSNSEDKEEIEIKAHKRKKREKTPIAQLPIDEVRVKDLPDSEKICPSHGVPLKQVGESSIVKLEIIPESRKVIKEVTPIYGPCSDFCGEEKKAQELYDILPQTAATPSLLSNLIVSKYEYSMPFYRIEKKWERLGIELTQATMASWTIKLSKKLQVLINLMNEDLMAQGYFQCDETHVNVLKLNGKRFESTSYIWVRYSPVVPIVIFEFHPTRSGDVPKSYLQDFSGFMQVDEYQGYNVISQFPNAIHVCCWFHARKGFYKAYKDEDSKLAKEVLKMIKALFKVDEEAAKKNMTPEQRKILRNEKSKPILNQIKEWLDKYHSQVRPTSYLGGAIEYTLSRWEKLIRFLEDGRIELSTNFVENKIRPFTLGRKNWLFFDTDNGADAGCIHYSLIESAKANGKSPCVYLENLYRELPKCKTLEDFEKLLPYDRKDLKTKLNID